jgi:hypothetical protein
VRRFRPMFVFPVGPPFRLRVSQDLDHATFPVPATSNPACGDGRRRMAKIVEADRRQTRRLKQRLEMAPHQVRFADRAAALGTEHKIVSRDSLVLREVPLQQGHDPRLELDYAAAA